MEPGEALRAGDVKAPRPEPLAVLGMPRLIDVHRRLAGQGRLQFRMAETQRGAGLLHDLGDLAGGQRQAQHVAQKGLDRGVRHVAGPLLEGQQRRQPRADQPGQPHVLGQRGGHDLARDPRAIQPRAMLRDLEQLLHQFNLLERAKLVERLPLGSRFRPLVVPGPVDLLRRKEGTDVPWMPRLAAASSLSPFAAGQLRLRRLDDVARRWFRRRAGVLFQPSDFRTKTQVLRFQFGDPRQQRRRRLRHDRPHLVFREQSAHATLITDSPRGRNTSFLESVNAYRSGTGSQPEAAGRG